MAPEEGERDEMDSLFEGMVLIDPSLRVDGDGGGGGGDAGDDKLQEQQQPVSLSPRTCRSTSSSPARAASHPLDENLFTDLALVNPDSKDPLILQLPPHSETETCDASTSTTTTSNREEVPPSLLSRQISTRKKKRAGLRIGYGRDALFPDVQHIDGRSSEFDPPQPPPPLPSSSLTDESESGRSAPQQRRQEHQQEELELEEASLSLTATTKMESDYSENTGASEEADPSRYNAANVASRDEDDSAVADAQPTATGLSKDQVKTSAPNAIELRYEQIRAQISQKLRHVRELVASASAARKDSRRRRRIDAETLNIASTRYRELEKELEAACEAEDFETAESVSESLASAEKDKERLAIDLRHAEEDCDAVDSRMHEVLELQIDAEEECSSLLKTFAMDTANDVDLVQKNAQVASEKELDRWFSLTEDLELKKMELDIEAHLVSAARLVLSDSIEHSVEDDKRERALLCKRKEMLKEELEKLLALVKKKEMEIAETDYKVEMVEKRISDVICSFQEVQSRVDMKYDNLQSGLSQMEQDNEALARKKKEIDFFLSQEKERGIRLHELAQISADESNMYQEAVEHRKNLVLLILNSREDKLRLAKTEDKLSEDVQMLRQEISAARASLQELSSTKSSLQQEIESLKQRLVFTDKRVPELEAEKKVAAAARNFKEAARIATECKTLSVEKESLQTKMAGAVLELRKLEEEICHTVNRLQEIDGQISTKEKEVAMARFQRLILIAGTAKAERSAALELGDPKEADILLTEAEASESEARKLQPIYEFKEEEFADLPKQYISMELVSSLGGKQLAELVASAYTPT
ncbi:uncharacterized protein LOC131330754 isoform X2 [Rhododendron vialii]|uniref:uncharacterized protein LOC131330754 isoform X2 n=1 Tax=Rhododendron vialii TaxID=182163 RepID=UPI0026601733|nr:uncharacterized protein LOC131330754 isoform X2 [Rhododendron vialii]